MSTDSWDVADDEPFEITKQPSDTDGDFVRFEATVHPGPDVEAPDVDLDHERFLLDNPDEHIHPHQEEVVEVLAGEYAVAFGGTEHRLSDGEEITVPQNTAHRHWNPVRVAHEHHPARDSAEHAEAMWALAQEGKTDERGIPNVLQFAVISKAYPAVHDRRTDSDPEGRVRGARAHRTAGGIPGGVLRRRERRTVGAVV